ncbi:MAG: C40 family peptidase [Clostridiales bacterium]|jgi:SH3-like domain-containing protein|nr:C40 family peptidase [Clostridiales bacterium]
MKNRMFKFLLGNAVVIGAALCMSVSAYARTSGSVTANKVNVRVAATLDSEVLFMANTGDAFEILEKEGDFYRIKISEDGSSAYIANQFVKIYGASGVVTDDFAWIYAFPPGDDGGEVYCMPGLNEAVSVLGICNDEWLQVKCNGIIGYMHKSTVDFSSAIALPQVEAPKAAVIEEAFVNLAFMNAGSTGEVDEIISFAKEYLGTRYVYGSMNPNKGFDCSGFVNYVLKNFDISVNRSSRDMATQGTVVDRGELQKGDLVFFATTGSGRISHVGMYIGDGQFIHASSWGEGVVISGLNEKYYSKCYVKATRVL